MASKERGGTTCSYDYSLLQKEKRIIIRETPEVNPIIFLPTLEARYPNIFNVMRKCGTYPIPSRTSLINFYTGEPMDESLHNIGVHLVATTIAARIITNKLADARGQNSMQLSNSDIEEIEKRSALHDLVEVPRIMKKIAGKKVKDDKRDPNSEIKDLEDFLEKSSVDDKHIQIAQNASGDTGRFSLSSFLKLDDQGEVTLVDDMWVRKIVHLADDMTSTSFPDENGHVQTLYLTPAERGIYSDFHSKYPGMFTSGFGFKNDGTAEDVSDVSDERQTTCLNYVKCYFDWQVYVSERICQEIKETVDPNNKEDSTHWMKNVVNEEFQKMSRKENSDYNRSIS